jgi:purine-binding chemotaxis protein CheW
MEQTATKEMQADFAAVKQYLTFALGNEEYGIELLRVQEIKGYSRVTAIPDTPAHIKGVMNLRGAVIPIVDLRTRFGMEAIEYTQFNVIIVINVGTKVMGLLVDAVSDVLNVGDGDLRPAPDFGAKTNTRFISGVVSVGEKVIVLLDITMLLSDADLAVVDSIVSEETGGTPKQN